MTQQDKELLIKYNAGLCTDAEKVVVEKWLFEMNNGPIGLSVEKLETIKAEIRSNLPLPGQNSTIVTPLWKRVAIAASIVICVGVGLLVYNQNKIKEVSQLAINDIAPGKNGATLTLGNGRKILINDALTGNIASESGVRISKTKDGQIVYEIIEGSSSTNAINTLSTTRGEQTQVRLPDGTLVFLNAESSLSYPATFAKLDHRKVSLQGEAYFEVTKDKMHPFIVESEGQKVEVLGTHFNINAYKGENVLKTTLVEGKVKVSGSNTNTRTIKILSPGEQSKISNNEIIVSKVNVEDALAWRLGVFQYDGETLENIMKDVERWYNVNVIYKDESIRKEQFYITANRYDKVSGMLELLERTKIVSFKLNGKDIIVEKK